MATIPSTMPAIRLPPGQYSWEAPPLPPALVFDTTTPTPKPSPDQYLINVQASAPCRGELLWFTVFQSSASPPPIPCHDFCGTIVGTPTTESAAGHKFKVGDEIFARIDPSRDGGAAHYALAYERELAFKPANITTIEAASIPCSALTAWQGFFQYGGLKTDSNDPIRILVLNASGGVGIQAISLLRSKTLFGSREVWICGTCSNRNASFVRDELRANEIVDYTSEPDISAAFALRGWEPVDLVLDCIGGEPLRQAHSSAVVRDGGSVLSICQPTPDAWADARAEIEKRKLNSQFYIITPNGEQLEKIASLIEKGEVGGCADRVFNLAETRQAMELVESKRVRGKVVLEMTD